MTSKFSLVRSVTTFSIVPFLAAVLLSSCLKNHHDEVNVPVAAIMAFNLATDKSSVGFSLSGNSLTSSPLGYGNYTGNYLNIYPGDRTVNAYDFYSSSVLYASSPGSFITDKFYSLFFVGANNKYKNVLVRDNFDSLSASSGKAYVRYINAVPDSVNAMNVTLSLGGNVVSQENAAYGTVSPFTEIGPGSLSIAIKNNDGIDTSRIITVDSKKVYTILLSGIRGSSSAPIEIKYISNGTLSDPAINNTGLADGAHPVN